MVLGLEVSEIDWLEVRDAGPATAQLPVISTRKQADECKKRVNINYNVRSQ